MITLGDYNTLRITKRVDFGLYLSPIGEGSLSSGDAAAPYEKILLPQRYVTPDMHIGDEIEVFLYLDHDERIVPPPSTLLPKLASSPIWNVPGPTNTALS